MSALRELARSRGDDVAVLAWVLQHAPDGDEAGALLAAWEAEDQPVVMMEVIRQMRRVEVAGAPDLWLVRQAKREEACAEFRNWRQDPAGGCPVLCPTCCAAIRSVTPAPTWAELMGEPAR